MSSGTHSDSSSVVSTNGTFAPAAGKASSSLREALSYMLAVGEDLPEEEVLRQVDDVLASDYRLGRVVKAEPIPGGLINFNAVVTTERSDGRRGQFFVRKYNSATTRRDVEYEHDLIAYLDTQGFDQTAQTYRTIGGGSIATRRERSYGAERDRLFAVFRYLPGEDRYSWVANRMSADGFSTAGTLLARFHHFAAGFDHAERLRTPATIADVLRLIPDAMATFAERVGDTAFDRVFLRDLKSIEQVAARCLSVCEPGEGLQHVVVHGDFSPGNVKFQGEQAAYVFDYDYARYDLRTFDIGFALGMFCGLWDGADAGHLDLDDMETWIRSYQKEAARYSLPGPLTRAEVHALPSMVAAGNLYVILWTANAYYARSGYDPSEWAGYLEHMLQLMAFIEDNQDRLLQRCSSAVLGGAGSL